uniref:Uncharacterized protein n=1 Tax=Rangifer tarandus platyrhynchus TaxID=3082113 RepID=A0ACB0FNX3_RANTA|nr:unnamed protein product [Rangifer tarandus platyrhynchus]
MHQALTAPGLASRTPVLLKDTTEVSSFGAHEQVFFGSGPAGRGGAARTVRFLRGRGGLTSGEPRRGAARAVNTANKPFLTLRSSAPRLRTGGIKIVISLDLSRGLRAAGAQRGASRGVPEPLGGARDAPVSPQALVAAGPSALAARIQRLLHRFSSHSCGDEAGCCSERKWAWTNSRHADTRESRGAAGQRPGVSIAGGRPCDPGQLPPPPTRPESPFGGALETPPVTRS